MRKIPIILGTIIAVCIMALLVIDITRESVPLSVEEKACIEAGFPVESLGVQDCAELLLLEKNVHRLRKTLEKLEKLINPGIDI